MGDRCASGEDYQRVKGEFLGGFGAGGDRDIVCHSES